MSVHPAHHNGGDSTIEQFTNTDPNFNIIEQLYDPPTVHSSHKSLKFNAHSIDNPYVLHAISQHNRECVIPNDQVSIFATINVKGLNNNSSISKFHNVLDSLLY